ncbi:MAG: YncE family protein [Hyphomicrobiaceae bacterium]|nr:YncE family protein [Hyphomicrobiaceae bacterium]
MRTLAGFIFAAVCLSLGGGAAPLQAGTVLVLSQTAAQLVAIDPETDTIRGVLQLDTSPANLAVSPDGQRAFVAHADIGRISIIDLPSWTVAVAIPAPGSPFGLAVSQSGKLYAGDWNSDQVHEIDTATGRVLRSAVIGKAPAHLALTPDGQLLIAVARETNAVSIIDPASFTVKTTLAVERAPFAIALNPRGGSAVVANAQAGSASTIDLGKLTVTASVPVGAMPYGVAYSGDGATVLITNQQSGTVSILGRPMGSPAGRAAIKVGSYPEGIALNSDSTRAYVANWFSDDVSIIDLTSGKEAARLKVPGGPRGVAFTTGSFGR